MKASRGAHFEQAYNAQATVDTEGSLRIPGVQMTDAPNDKQQLIPTLQSVDPEVRKADITAASGSCWIMSIPRVRPSPPP